MGLNLKHAQYIMEIIKEGSITNASKTMHVSQPALSQTIKAVEKYLGAPIFLRNTKPIVLTEAGKKYIAAVKRSLPSVRTCFMKSRTSNMKGTVSCDWESLFSGQCRCCPGSCPYSASAIPTSNWKSRKQGATLRKKPSSMAMSILPS